LEETKETHGGHVSVTDLIATEDSLNLPCGHHSWVLRLFIQFIQWSKHATEGLKGHIFGINHDPLPRRISLEAESPIPNTLSELIKRTRLRDMVIIFLIIRFIVIFLFMLYNGATVKLRPTVTATRASLRKVIVDLLCEPAINAAEVEGVVA
jgi:hypothetical protein